jgi:nitrate/nitrite transport system permease protein
MVSAVFHSATAAKDVAVVPVAAPAPVWADAQAGYDWNDLLMAIMPPVLGLLLLVLIWSMVSMATAGSIPTPMDTLKQAIDIFSDPFYRKGPNDQGVGWNVLASLQRVALGFGLAALVGIPAGFVIGRFEFMSRMFNPLISLMRPVSPLAWLPIGLLVFKGAHPAAIWTIFICSI